MADIKYLTLTEATGGDVAVAFNLNGCPPVMRSARVNLPLVASVFDRVTDDLQAYGESLGLQNNGLRLAAREVGVMGNRWYMPSHSKHTQQRLAGSYAEKSGTATGTIIELPPVIILNNNTGKDIDLTLTFKGSLEPRTVVVLQSLPDIIAAVNGGIESLHDRDAFIRQVTEGTQLIADEVLTEGKQSLDQIKLQQAPRP